METHAPKQEGTSFTDLFLRAIAVLGLIAVLLLGAWGIIQLAVAIPNLFSNGGSLFGTTAATQSLTVSAPSTTTSGQTVQLSWTHNNADKNAQYSYAISYACGAGLSLGAPVPTGSYQGVACNTPFNYTNATAHLTLIPVYTGTASAPIVFTVTATKLATGAITATGNATTTVNPNTAAATAKPAATTKPTATVAKPKATKPSTAYYPATTHAALYGYADLAVRVMSVTPTTGTTNVQFVIENDGTNVVASGWTFNATLPINGSYSFASQPQQALYPGDKIVYQLSFSNTYGAGPYQNGYSYTGVSAYSAGGYTCNGYNCVPPTNSAYNYNNTGYQVGTIIITADPFNYIAETNKNNNTATASTPLY